MAATNPGASVVYNPANPFNVGVPGTGDYSGAEMNSAQGLINVPSTDAYGTTVTNLLPANAPPGSPVVPVVPTPKTITSTTLQPTAPTNFSTVAGTPPSDVSSLPTTYSLTAPEQNAQDLTTQLENLNNQLTGKSAATTAAQNAAGLPALQSQQNDLSAQLAALKAQAAAIPSQYQDWATGRGVTAEGLAPLQSAATRNNAVQALGISAMLDATNGLIASANQKVTDAINTQFGPIEDQITALTNNLKLIQNSPDYTEAEKAQAADQAAAVAKQQAALDQAKTDKANVYSVALEAAKNGADAQTLNNILNAKDQASAITAAGTSLQTPPTTQVVDVNGRKVMIDSKTGATIKDLGSSTTVSDTKTAQTQADYKAASQFLTDNPNASDADIRNALLQNTKNLSVTDINALIATRHPSITTPATLTDSDLSSISSGLLQQLSSTDALAAVQSGTLTINGKSITLTADQQKQLTDKLNPSATPTKPWWQFW